MNFIIIYIKPFVGGWRLAVGGWQHCGRVRPVSCQTNVMSERTERDRDRDRDRGGSRGGGGGGGGGGGVGGGGGGGAGGGGGGGVGGGARSVPRDAHAIMGMLKELGVTEFDPRVVTQLLEFAHRYVSAVLEDARVFAGHAKKKTVEAEDVRLAAAGHAERAFTAPPPRELLLEVTRGKNLAPLPLIKPHCGLRLPPDRFCLSACNYRLARARRPRPAGAIVTPASVPPPLAPASAPSSSPATLKRPPTLVTVSKTQAVSVPKPVFKFSSAGKTNSKPVTIKMEVDSDLKRKREDDDYDVL